ncbi:MAG: YbaN family protein [Ignavibacteriae bacterium]|nr:YbaN family protein [Ignavibacteriota bacterium]
MNHQHRFVRFLFVLAGTLSVALGIIGIFVPLLPTVPFLLLAAYCYAKSSEMFYHWLLTNKWFGKIIRDYKEGKGVPVRVKVYSITFLWFVVGYSTFYALESRTVKIVLFIVGIAVTIHLMLLKSYRKDS